MGALVPGILILGATGGVSTDPSQVAVIAPATTDLSGPLKAFGFFALLAVLSYGLHRRQIRAFKTTT